MKILFVSHSKNASQTVITVMHGTEENNYETYLYNEDGYQELWTTATNCADAVMYHKTLCEKCGIRLNM